MAPLGGGEEHDPQASAMVLTEAATHARAMHCEERSFRMTVGPSLETILDCRSRSPRSSRPTAPWAVAAQMTAGALLLLSLYLRRRKSVPTENH